MKKIIYIIMLVLLSVAVNAASIWVDDFNDCPNNYAAQNCLVGGELACGYDGSNLHCSAPAEIIPPTTDTRVTTQNDVNDSFNGGFLIDCIDYNTPDPFCNNDGAYWCDYNSTCWGTQYRYTNCTANTFGQSHCSDCRTNYNDCDTDTAPCEILENSACGVAGSSEDYNGCAVIGSGGYGNCTCNGNYRDCNNDDSDNNIFTAHRTTGECEVLLGSTSYPTGQNNHYVTDCNNCACNTGYTDCDASGDCAGNGCESQDGVTACSGGSHNNQDAGCVCQCDSGWEDCDASGKGAGTGCEYQVNKPCATNALNLSSCANCTCTDPYIDCNADLSLGLAGDGCEIENGGSCTVGGLSGTYNGCTCEVDPVNYGTSGITYNWSGTDPFLGFNQLGAGYLFWGNATGKIFSINGTGIYYDGNDLTETGGGGMTPHDINGTNHTGNLSSQKVKKETGTSWLSQLLDAILDLIRTELDDLRGENQTQHTNISNMATKVSRITSTNCTGEVVAYFYENGTGVCEPDNSGGAADVDLSELLNKTSGGVMEKSIGLNTGAYINDSNKGGKFGFDEEGNFFYQFPD